MTRTTTGTAAYLPSLGTALGLSLLGGGAVWLITGEPGHAVTVAVIGLIIGLAIFVMLSLGRRRR